MSAPVDIEPARFFDFIARPGLAVVFLSLHDAHPFNHALPRHLCEPDGSAPPIGRVSLIELVVFATPAAVFLEQGLRACGISKLIAVLPGYYLFDSGQLLAWESGIVSTADGESMARASLLGLISYVFARDVLLVLRALQFGAQESIAARIAAKFRAAAEQPRVASRPAPPPRPEDELLNAYRLLGVDPNASDREVHAAWRRLQAEVHPDRVAGDPQEFERRSRLAAQINRAREIIRAHRARAGS